MRRGAVSQSDAAARLHASLGYAETPHRVAIKDAPVAQLTLTGEPLRSHKECSQDLPFIYRNPVYCEGEVRFCCRIFDILHSLP